MPLTAQAIIGICVALPDLISLITRIAVWLHKASGGDIPGFVKSLADVFSQLENANTQEKKIDAIKSYSDFVAGLKR